MDPTGPERFSGRRGTRIRQERDRSVRQHWAAVVRGEAVRRTRRIGGCECRTGASILERPVVVRTRGSEDRENGSSSDSCLYSDISFHLYTPAPSSPL